jgi:hypothetical protein
LPAPPPLRTVHATFTAYGSSSRQRALTARGRPIGLGANLDVSTAEPATELPAVCDFVPSTIRKVSTTSFSFSERRVRWMVILPSPFSSQVANPYGRDLDIPGSPRSESLTFFNSASLPARLLNHALIDQSLSLLETTNRARIVPTPSLLSPTSRCYLGNAKAPASTFGLRLKLYISVPRAVSKTMRRFSGSKVSASIQRVTWPAGPKLYTL